MSDVVCAGYDWLNTGQAQRFTHHLDGGSMKDAVRCLFVYEGGVFKASATVTLVSDRDGGATFWLTDARWMFTLYDLDKCSFYAAKSGEASAAEATMQSASIRLTLRAFDLNFCSDWATFTSEPTAIQPVVLQPCKFQPKSDVSYVGFPELSQVDLEEEFVMLGPKLVSEYELKLPDFTVEHARYDMISSGQGEFAGKIEKEESGANAWLANLTSIKRCSGALTDPPCALVKGSPWDSIHQTRLLVLPHGVLDKQSQTKPDKVKELTATYFANFNKSIADTLTQWQDAWKNNKHLDKQQKIQEIFKKFQERRKTEQEYSQRGLLSLNEHVVPPREPGYVPGSAHDHISDCLY
eukprot:TRINITY_DN79567_c0_g1_i1.p1 TRINITY_DN79567_c0_g1~~TRINITY_DN79567_c0_g1_i1.p1  ORF type:complete len:352 (-),score=17.85 TRINITY_DN79567_c0_g1_i1:43-1098(-)